jgi:hypothetical protein
LVYDPVPIKIPKLIMSVSLCSDVVSFQGRENISTGLEHIAGFGVLHNVPGISPPKIKFGAVLSFLDSDLQKLPLPGLEPRRFFGVLTFLKPYTGFSA